MPMNETIDQLLQQMAALETRILQEIEADKSIIRFTVTGKKVAFEASVLQGHRQLKQSFWKWVRSNRPQNLLTGPIIYAMAVPMVMVDVCVSFYQWSCFPVYGIAKVKREDYFIYDRQQLAYLNWIEKFHCTYCAYGNGLMAYMTEILGKTEAYFCPIKHARKVQGIHTHYKRFIDYGDATDYAARLEAFRRQMNQQKNEK